MLFQIKITTFKSYFKSIDWFRILYISDLHTFCLHPTRSRGCGCREGGDKDPGGITPEIILKIVCMDRYGMVGRVSDRETWGKEWCGVKCFNTPNCVGLVPYTIATRFKKAMFHSAPTHTHTMSSGDEKEYAVPGAHPLTAGSSPLVPFLPPKFFFPLLLLIPFNNLNTWKSFTRVMLVWRHINFTISSAQH